MLSYMYTVYACYRCFVIIAYLLYSFCCSIFLVYLAIRVAKELGAL